MASYDYDVIVIGSGAAGSIAAQQVASAGKSVAIIESGELGGQILNYSSVPVKALLNTASIYEAAKRGSKFGIRSSTIGYNYPSVKAWKDSVAKRTSLKEQHEYFTNKGINVVSGRAYFIDKHTVSVGSARFSAAKFVIASGSEMVLPKIPGLNTAGFLTHKEAINLTRPPKSIAIIGGGATGLEFAQLFAIFGSKVTLIESSPSLLREEEPEVSRLMLERLKKEYNVTVTTETVVKSVEKVGLTRKLTLGRKQKTATINVSEVMLASGSTAIVDIGLDNAGVRYSKTQIYVDRYQRTTASHIYAAGDCTGPYTYAHAAAYQGQVVAQNIVHPRSPVSADLHAVPRVFWTNPEIAATGITEQDAKARGIPFTTVTLPISGIAKAATSGFTDGFIKVVSNKKTGALLGATIVCPQAGELIHELTLAIQYHLTAQQVAHTVHAFGTWSEIIRIACAKLDAAK